MKGRRRLRRARLAFHWWLCRFYLRYLEYQLQEGLDPTVGMLNLPLDCVLPPTLNAFIYALQTQEMENSLEKLLDFRDQQLEGHLESFLAFIFCSDVLRCGFLTIAFQQLGMRFDGLYRRFLTR